MTTRSRKVAFRKSDYSSPGCFPDDDKYEVASSIGESEETSSVVESLYTQSSKGSGIRNEMSAEERRLEQRQKQIDYGKV